MRFAEQPFRKDLDAAICVAKQSDSIPVDRAFGNRCRIGRVLAFRRFTPLPNIEVHGLLATRQLPRVVGRERPVLWRARFSLCLKPLARLRFCTGRRYRVDEWYVMMFDADDT